MRRIHRYSTRFLFFFFFITKLNSKMQRKEPQWNEFPWWQLQNNIFRVPWHFITSEFHCTWIFSLILQSWLNNKISLTLYELFFTSENKTMRTSLFYFYYREIYSWECKPSNYEKENKTKTKQQGQQQKQRKRNTLSTPFLSHSLSEVLATAAKLRNAIKCIRCLNNCDLQYFTCS